ncbi:MAG: O-antigen ligase family protein [Flavobacteriales bacterium]|nr:O-antigen ligase family protein [Flavobacteriales bacterium]MBK6550509.1 O-antigen ligase family protein [Flavobacteriales bacterium]MBK6882934.1 O-antigen ligase family protein [Flavobacteriales bacterium]MBK7101922.1 O-antigen ligase family protein [Flavobacteriales bacterium]MBK7114272.1 O-antigen ligase family protein [Flavobacteriales bacterium]
MEISKRKLINFLFVLSFPFYGIGMYMGYKTSISQGSVIAVIPFLGIIFLHVYDLIRGRKVRVMVGRLYWIALLFLLSLVAAMWKALSEHFPGASVANTVAYSILFLAPFHGSIIVHIRNRDAEDFDFAKLVLKGMATLILLNVLGVAAGISNVLHNIEGRINLPFMLGIYSSAHLLAMTNLILMFYMKDFAKKPRAFMVLFAFYMLNMALMLSVNSRLSFMTFLILSGLFFFRMIGRARIAFPLSLFTMPLLTNFALLVYWVLTLPFMVAIVSRVNKADVTTFNNRTTVWDVGWNWLEHDRSDILFGKGYQGQIYLKGWDHIAEVFNVRYSYLVHTHSTFMQTLVTQGIVGYGLFLFVMWHLFKFYRDRFMKGTQEAPLFAAIIYMLFILQIDIICYGNDFGNGFIFCLMAMVVMDPKYITRPTRSFNGDVMDVPELTAPRSDDAAPDQPAEAE